jgi:hypothetical protein
LFETKFNLGGGKMPVEDNEENMKICKQYCGDCPSYPQGTDEWLFCAKGKCSKSIERQGCICPGCDVYEKYDLSTTYYCDVGAEE